MLHARNPRLVYGQATGYGTSGPSKDNVAMDLTVQARMDRGSAVALSLCTAAHPISCQIH